MSKKKTIRRRNLSEDKAQDQKDRAVEFLRRVKSFDAADNLEDESLESYAMRKGIRIDENPRRRKKTAARKKPRSKVRAKKANPRRRTVLAKISRAGAKRSVKAKASRRARLSTRTARRARLPKKQNKRRRNFGINRFLGRKPRVTSQTWDRAGEKRRAHALKKAGVSSKHLPAYTDYTWRDMQSSFDPGFISKVMSGLRANPKRPKPPSFAKRETVKEARARVAAAATRRKRKRNQGGEFDRAGQTYAMFHGRGPSQTVTVHGMTADPKDRDGKTLAGLGTLVSMVIGNNDYQINWGKGERPPLLATDAGAEQLYIVGGDQDISAVLRSLGVKGTQDLVNLGEVTMAEYYTQKKFDNFQPIVYYHHFGEEDAKNPRRKPRRPRLIYSRRNRKLMLVGGAYKIRKEGIVN